MIRKAPHWLRGRFKAVPRPLLAVLAAAVLSTAGWSLAVPLLQGPDEAHHVSYVQSVAEHEVLGARKTPLGQSTEVSTLLVSTRNSSVLQNLSGRPPWTEGAQRRWRAHDERIGQAERSDAGALVGSPYGTRPYYGYQLPAYFAARSGSLVDRMQLMRLANIPLVIVTLIFVWLLAGAVLEARATSLARTVTCTAVGLQPMYSFLSGTVHPDTLNTLVWTAFIYFGVLIIKRDRLLMPLIALAGTTVLAVLSKPIYPALVPALVLLLIVAAWKICRSWTPIVRGPVLAGVSVATALVVWVVFTELAYELGIGSDPPGSTISPTEKMRWFGSYLWQWALPALPFMYRFEMLHPSLMYESWLQTFWAAFGHLEVRFGQHVYLALVAVSALWVAGVIWVLVRTRALCRHFPVLGFFTLLFLGLSLAIHWAGFKLMIASVSDLFIQGRFLFPLISLFGLGFGAVVAVLPSRVRVAVASAIVGGFVLLDLASILLTAGRFYT